MFTLKSGKELSPGQKLISENGKFTFVMQNDGNLVLYYRGKAYWASGTSGRSPKKLIMQDDGNLVIYFNDAAPWSTRTNGNGPSHLVMQDDGNVVIYKNSGGHTWATGTNGIEFKPMTSSAQDTNGRTTARCDVKASRRPDGTGFIELSLKVKITGIAGTGYATAIAVLTDEHGNTLWKSSIVRKHKGSDTISGVARGTKIEDFSVEKEIMKNVSRVALIVQADMTSGFWQDPKDVVETLNQAKEILSAAKNVAKEVASVVAIVNAF